MESREKARRLYARHGESRVIGFRIPVKLAEAVKMEAAQRNVPLNVLLAEMWELYKGRKRAA